MTYTGFSMTGEKKQIGTMEELSDAVLARVFLSRQELSEEDRKRLDARIWGKLQAGKKLTQEEMEYLRRYNPTLYFKALRVQKLAEAVEEQLKHAKSKEEADNIVFGAMAGISDSDPDKGMLTAAVQEVSAQFHRFTAYARLPLTVQEEDKGAGSENAFAKQTAEGSDDDFDVMHWSVLDEGLAVFDQGA